MPGMYRNLKYLFMLLLLSVYACKKEHPKPTPPTGAIQDPLLSKLTLTTPDKTYIDTYSYDTVGDYRNCVNRLRSEITGKVYMFSYAHDVSMRVTLYKVYEYDINTNQLLDTYLYTGYYTGEPATPPYQKDVTVTDPNNNLLRTFTYVRGDLNAPVRAIAVGSDTTTRITNNSAGNMLLFDTGHGNTITYTYDNKHHPDALLDWENEHLSFFSLRGVPNIY